MSHEVCLADVDHPLDPTMTTNYTPNILICDPEYWNQDLEQ